MNKHEEQLSHTPNATKLAKVEQMMRQGWVSPLQALQESGSMRLAAQVYYLKHVNGLTIEDKWDSESKKYKLYRIVDSV
jgi:hypothetical protein